MQSIEIRVHSRLFLARYKGCTSARCILAKSCGHEEFKNVNASSVLYAQKGAQTCQYPCPQRHSTVQSMEIRIHSRLFLARYKGCTNAKCMLSRNYGNGEFKNVNPFSVLYAQKGAQTCQFPYPQRHSTVQSMEIRVHSRLFIARYKGCTSARCILSKSCGHEEFKNLNPFSVLYAQKGAQACQ